MGEKHVIPAPIDDESHNGPDNGPLILYRVGGSAKTFQTVPALAGRVVTLVSGAELRHTYRNCLQLPTSHHEHVRTTRIESSTLSVSPYVLGVGVPPQILPRVHSWRGFAQRQCAQCWAHTTSPNLLYIVFSLFSFSFNDS